MTSNVDKLRPNDPRVQQKTTKLGGRTYGYILGEPQGTRKGTIFLIHGFPDLGFGWRYQVPFLMKLGLRVVVPDMMGYGRTDAPPYSLAPYGYKQIADDMKELAEQLDEPHIVIAGHDWGGAAVYRIALHHPTLVTHVISICTPYFLPQSTYIPLQSLVSGPLPVFGYQLQFASGSVEENIPPTAEGVRQFLTVLHGGGRTTDGAIGFEPRGGVRFSLLSSLKPSPLMAEDEMTHYISEYTRPKTTPNHPPSHPLHGPLTWYRTREHNHFTSDLALLDPKTEEPAQFPCPLLFIAANKEVIATKELWEKMPEQIEDVTMKNVDTGHWALVEAPAEVNRLMGDWIEERVFGGAKGAKL